MRSRSQTNNASARTGRHRWIRQTTLAALIAVVALPGGCGSLAYRLSSDAPQQYVPNPLELPAVSDDFLWLQVVDTLDDYFRIARQQPVVNSRGLVLEGKLETSYKIGGSIFQPWQKDTTTGFERLQSTLQTIRRRAIVTVRPETTGYSVEVIVQKDLEDTDRTQHATESVIGTRHDGSRTNRADRFGDSPQTLGWIPLGRDSTLEQAILKDIFGRVTRPDASHVHRH